MEGYYLGDIELTDETLAHYGVKGMKWRKRKKPSISNKDKNDKYIDIRNRRTRQRHITGSAKPRTNRKGDRITPLDEREARALNNIYNARTNEQRAALTTDYINQHIKQNYGTARKVGDQVNVHNYQEHNHQSVNVTPYDIEYSKQGTSRVLEEARRLRRERKKKNS